MLGCTERTQWGVFNRLRIRERTAGTWQQSNKSLSNKHLSRTLLTSFFFVVWASCLNAKFSVKPCLVLKCLVKGGSAAKSVLKAGIQQTHMQHSSSHTSLSPRSIPALPTRGLLRAGSPSGDTALGRVPKLPGAGAPAPFITRLHLSVFGFQHISNHKRHFW